MASHSACKIRIIGETYADCFASVRAADAPNRRGRPHLNDFKHFDLEKFSLTKKESLLDKFMDFNPLAFIGGTFNR